MVRTTNSELKQWGIGDVARQAGVTARTLRYYEELGLLAPARDAGARRRYDNGSLDRTRRVTLLVYRDIAAGHAYLVSVLGLAPGPITYDGDRPVHGEVHAGDGVVWLHREAPEHHMVSPLTTGTVTASLAILVDDVDAHHARVAAADAEIDYEPTDMPYGVREYGVRDPEDHLWSFQTPLTEFDEQETP